MSTRFLSAKLVARRDSASRFRRTAKNRTTTYTATEEFYGRHSSSVPLTDFVVAAADLLGLQVAEPDRLFLVLQRMTRSSI